MSEMIERVAKAIHNAQMERSVPGGSIMIGAWCMEWRGKDWETIPPAHIESYVSDMFYLSRAAIEAMRDNLTDGMGEIIAKHGGCCGGIAHTIWVEACDEALKP